MRTSIFLTLLVAGCGSANDAKSTGTTFWDLGVTINEGSDLAGNANVDMTMGPLFPLTLTPLTTPQTQTANISLYFQVTDARGNGVAGLTGDQFTYTEDGVTPDPSESHFTVTPLSGSTLSIPTVLVLDVSGSVTANLMDIQNAAKAIVAKMLPEQQIALMVFADTPKVTQTFTSDQTALNTAIDNIGNANVGVSTNLYGAGISAVGLWTDGFQNDPTMTKLTTGLAIIVTDGADEAAVNTLQDYVTARGNKRVITVGIGSSIDVNVLKEMQTAGFIQETSYSALVSDIQQVTDKIETLAHSIYSANYCSPKRAGSMHELVFTVIGNPLADINATCTPATFSSSAPAACAMLQDQTHTQACEENGGNTICCPYDAPYYCPGINNCYLTAADAQAVCNSTCLLCGGTGNPTTTNTGLQPGPAIHVQFDATNYKSTQCPVFWGTNCKALQACCPGVVPSTEETNCVSALTSAQGDEPTCATQIANYCPTLDSSCMSLSSCCGTYPSSSTAASNCQQALFQQRGSGCGMLGSQYCPSPSPTPAPCADLKNCCLGLAGQFGQANCITSMINEDTGLNAATNCTASSAQYCPMGTNCKALEACCDKFGQTEQQQCYSTLISDETNKVGSENNCLSSQMQYCATTTNCMALQTCCMAKSTTSTGTGTTRDQCEQNLVNSNGVDTLCKNYLTSNGC